MLWSVIWVYLRYNTDGEPGDEWRGSERRVSVGYVGLYAATTRTGSLVTSGGARSAELRRVMWVYLPLKHGRGDP